MTVRLYRNVKEQMFGLHFCLVTLRFNFFWKGHDEGVEEVREARGGSTKPFITYFYVLNILLFGIQ